MMIRSFFTVLVLVMFSLNGFASPAMEKRDMESGVEDSEFQKLIYSVRLRIPHGNSDWAAAFAPTGSNPLMIRLLAEPSCGQGPGVFVFVRRADTHQWEQTVHLNGFDTYSGGKIDGLRFQMSQYYVSNLTCTFNIYAKEGADQPVPTSGTLIGAINYTGGFQQSASIEINPARFVNGLRVEVPAFCAGVTVLEASTVTEGVADKAKLVEHSQNYFSVNNGAGSRISRILLALNGPVGSMCQLPIYVYEK